MTKLFKPAYQPTEPPQLRGPITDAYLRALQKRLAEKRAAAIAYLGDHWLLHPSRRIR